MRKRNWHAQREARPFRQNLSIENSVLGLRESLQILPRRK